MVIVVNVTYDSMLAYAMREDRLGEEFFEGRVNVLRRSVEERLGQIERRERVHEQILKSIEIERDERQRQFRMLPYREAAVRTTLMRQLDALGREARGELRVFAKDVAQLSRDAREKLEEYEGMSQLFGALAMTRREGRGDGV